MAVTPDPIFQFIRPASQGDAGAMRKVFPLIYSELFAIARNIRFNFHGIDTFNTTAIIHEAYLKLSSNEGQWESKAHFYAVAAKAMRQVMLNAARNKQREKGEAVRWLPVSMKWRISWCYRRRHPKS